MESMPLHGADAEATTATELSPAIELGRVRHLLTEHADVIALVMITAVAAGVRFATLGMQGLDHDESVTAAVCCTRRSEEPSPQSRSWSVRRPSTTCSNGSGPRPSASERTRPTSASCRRCSERSPFRSRSWQARELSSRRAGVMTAALVALNPFLVWYSQEARAYGPVLFVALGLYVFARALSKPTRGRLTVWALVSILAIFTHYFAVFTVVPEAAWLFWTVRPRRRPFAAVAAVGVAGGALLPLAVSQQGSNATEWFKETSILTRAWQTPVHFASTVKPEIPSIQAWISHFSSRSPRPCSRQ